MNQIQLGPGVGIDTDEVQYWEHRNGDAPRTVVQFKNGKEVILRGEAKAAFEAWVAEGRKEPPEVRCETCAYYGYETGAEACGLGEHHATFPICHILHSDARLESQRETSRVEKPVRQHDHLHKHGDEEHAHLHTYADHHDGLEWEP